MKSPCIGIRQTAALALLAALGAQAASPSAQQPAFAEFSDLQRAAAKARKAETAALQDKESLCTNADEMDDLLLLAGGELTEVGDELREFKGTAEARLGAQSRFANLAVRVRALAELAQTRREGCERAEREAVQAKALRKSAVSQLSALAARSVGSVAPASTAAAASAPLRAEVRALIADAQVAQAKAEERRQGLAGIYEEVDRATASALSLTAKADAGLLDRALDLQAGAAESRAKRARAQKAATQLVDKALQLKRCDLLDYSGPCAGDLAMVYGQAQAASRQLTRALEESDNTAQKVLDDALEINVGADHPPGPARIKAYRFAKVLENYPDAKAPFAKDSFEILGGSTGVASLQIGLNSILPAGWNRVSLTVSAPLTEGQGDLFGSADGLANSRSFTFAWQAARLPGRLLGTANWLWAASLEIGWGYETRSYYEDGPMAFSKGSVDKTVLPWKWGTAMAFHEVGSRNAHLVTVQAQRTHDLSPAEIRCPAGPNGDLMFVSCVQSAFGPPKRHSAAVLGYEYRFKGADFALSPSITFNTRSRVTTLGLPIYLVRSAEDEKRPLNAGIRLAWSSKGRTSITDRTDSLWTWGIFVGAPFKLFGE